MVAELWREKENVNVCVKWHGDILLFGEDMRRNPEITYISQSVLSLHSTQVPPLVVSLQTGVSCTVMVLLFPQWTSEVHS